MFLAKCDKKSTLQQLTYVVDELFELRFVQTIGIFRRVYDLVETASCTQLHNDHLVLVLHLYNNKNGSNTHSKVMH